MLLPAGTYLGAPDIQKKSAKIEYRIAIHTLVWRMFGDKSHFAVSSGCPLKVGNNAQSGEKTCF